MTDMHILLTKIQKHIGSCRENELNHLLNNAERLHAIAELLNDLKENFSCRCSKSIEINKSNCLSLLSQAMSAILSINKEKIILNACYLKVKHSITTPFFSKIDPLLYVLPILHSNDYKFAKELVNSGDKFNNIYFINTF
ncbi:hypothetical protein GKODMF_11010 [Candidatus Electrothrix gigas]